MLASITYYIPFIYFNVFFETKRLIKMNLGPNFKPKKAFLHTTYAYYLHLSVCKRNG